MSMNKKRIKLNITSIGCIDFILLLSKKGYIHQCLPNFDVLQSFRERTAKKNQRKTIRWYDAKIKTSDGHIRVVAEMRKFVCRYVFCSPYIYMRTEQHQKRGQLEHCYYFQRKIYKTVACFVTCKQSIDVFISPKYINT